MSTQEVRSGAVPPDVREKLLRPGASVAVRAVRAIGWFLVYAGLFLLGFVAHQLWVTDLFANRAQRGLEAQLEERVERGAQVVVYDPATGEFSESLGVVPPEVLAGGDPDRLADALGGLGDPSTTPGEFPVAGLDHLLFREAAPEAGEPIGTIRIPDAGVHWTVVEGVRRRQLDTGAGHMPDTPLPGQPGNAVVSGHRTTHGAPFHDLGELGTGDRIFWDSAAGTHEYVVRETQIVLPTELWVTDPRPGAWITLTTCHPKFSARQRLIVFAELVAGPNHPAIYASS